MVKRKIKRFSRKGAKAQRRRMKSRNSKGVSSVALEQSPPGFIRCRLHNAVLMKIRCLERREMARKGYWNHKNAVLRMSFDVCRDCRQGREIEAQNRRLKNKPRNTRKTRKKKH